MDAMFPSRDEEGVLFEKAYEKFYAQLTEPENGNSDGLDEVLKWYKEVLVVI